MPSGTVFVAGATGYLGGYLTKELRKRGYKVRALVRSQADADALGASLGDAPVVGDVTRPETLRGKLDGCCAVVSALGMRGAPPEGVGYVDAMVALNRDGLRGLFDEAASAGTVTRFVVVASLNSTRRSSAAAAAREDAIDHIKQRCAELAAAGGGAGAGSGGGGGGGGQKITWTIMEPSAFFKDIDGMYKRTAKTKRASLLGGGFERRFNPIHGADLAARIADSLQDPGDENARVPVGGPETFTFREAFQMMGDVAGVQGLKFSSLPMWMATLLLVALSLVARFVPPLQRMVSFLAFLRTVCLYDSVGTPYGTHRLRPYLEQLAADAEKELRQGGRY